MEASQRAGFSLTPAFFGLNSEYRKLLHEEIFSLVYKGGGFSWTEVFDMPITWRRYYLRQLKSWLAPSTDLPADTTTVSKTTKPPF